MEQNYKMEFLDLSSNSMICISGFKRNVFTSNCFMRSSVLTPPDRLIESLADLFLRISCSCLFIGSAHVKDQRREFNASKSV